jgi:4-hydroxy-3-methylbut-2-enyl diphosphate reductase
VDITVAKESGFCFGVKLAVDSANKALQEGGVVYCLGQLIHNDSVTNELQDKGLVFVEDINQVPNNGKILFRSHGVPKVMYDIAKSKNLAVIDSTCPFVTKIHKIVESHYKQGYSIVIVGKCSHPEVVGINGWCGDTALVVESENDLTNMQADKQYCVVSQTTNNQELWQKIIKKIEQNNAITFDFFDTICYTTISRQKEARIVSSDSDVMLVLGNKQSANTNKLLDICKSNCQYSYLVQGVEDLNQLDVVLRDAKTVGITAGASTPYDFVQQVVSILEQQYNVVSDVIA